MEIYTVKLNQPIAISVILGFFQDPHYGLSLYYELICQILKIYPYICKEYCACFSAISYELLLINQSLLYFFNTLSFWPTE